METVFLNGRFIAANEAKISIFDHGFLYGDGLFETMRAYDGKVFKLEPHLQRLIDGSREVDLKIPYQVNELARIIQETVSRNKFTDAYVRLTVSRGIGNTGPDPSTCREATVLVVARPLRPHPEGFYQRGMKVIVLKHRRNELSPLSHLKTLNFLDNILGKIEVKKAAADEGIFLNTRDYVAEGTVSNIFLVQNCCLITPSIESGILPGITRATVIELARKNKINVEERFVEEWELVTADECFMTNSLMEIMPVCLINRKRIGSGRPSPLTLELSVAYKEAVVSS